MQSIKKKNKLLIGTLLVFGSCTLTNLALAETTDTQTSHESHHEQTNTEWPGLYNGFIPCEDCTGIKTSLALNSNNTYLLIRQYVGKSDREIVEKGKFSTGNNNNILVLTPRNNIESTVHYYSVSENSLTQLDNNGNPITGKKADKYILRKNDIKPPKGGGHAGH